jgi:hypothetical protein
LMIIELGCILGIYDVREGESHFCQIGLY